MKELKAFILRGNVVDLAVGVVVGAAFANVVTAFVQFVLTPLLAMPGTVDFSQLAVQVGGGTIRYGLFLNALISFLVIVVSVFFFVVKPLERLMRLRKTAHEVEGVTRSCPECLSAIPVAARRCAFCTAEVPPAPL